MGQLQRTSHQTYCPYKGECSYYSISAGGERAVNAVWTYEAPYAAVSEIKDYLVFYPRWAALEQAREVAGKVAPELTADGDDLIQRFTSARVRILRHLLERMRLRISGPPVE